MYLEYSTYIQRRSRRLRQASKYSKYSRVEQSIQQAAHCTSLHFAHYARGGGGVYFRVESIGTRVEQSRVEYIHSLYQRDVTQSSRVGRFHRLYIRQVASRPNYVCRQLGASRLKRGELNDDAQCGIGTYVEQSRVGRVGRVEWSRVEKSMFQQCNAMQSSMQASGSSRPWMGLCADALERYRQTPRTLLYLPYDMYSTSMLVGFSKTEMQMDETEGRGKGKGTHARTGTCTRTCTCTCACTDRYVYIYICIFWYLELCRCRSI